MAISFWTCGSGPTDAVLVWSDPIHHSGANNPFGSTNDEIQKTFVKNTYKLPNGSEVDINKFNQRFETVL